MSANIAISLRGVSKSYAIYRKPADRLKQMLWQGRKKFYQDFLAVSDINLDIYRGETLGIVGRNGSGKSTILKMICGTLQPTQGEVKIHGRIAALLELGAGFNPEFTGQENVFMKGTILGLNRQEIEDRYDAILKFADIGRFIDQPVKTYSSGMYTRLAFAVSISVDPDILIIDEVLAVGDDAFKRKCFSRIEEIRDSGSTILFVSHAASSIVELCDRAILMDRGNLLLTGDPKTIINKYQKLIYAPPNKQAEIRQEIQQFDQEKITDLISIKESNLSDNKNSEQNEDDGDFNPHLKPQSTVEYISRGAKISNIRILTQKGKPVNILKPNKQYIYEYEVRISQPVINVRCGMLIKTIKGIELGGIVTHPKGKGIEYLEAGTVLKVVFHFRTLLNSGAYFLNAGIVGTLDGEEGYLHRIIDAFMFRIEPDENKFFSGYIDFSDGKIGLAEIVYNSGFEVSLKA